MSGLLGGIFADVVFFPRSSVLPAVLIAAVVLVAVGVLVYFTRKSRKKNGKGGKK